MILVHVGVAKNIKSAMERICDMLHIGSLLCL